MTPSLQIRTKLALLVGDLALLGLSLALGTYLRVGDVWFSFQSNHLATVFYLAITPLCLYLNRAYEVRPEASSAENLRRALLGILVAMIAISFFFYFAPAYRFARGIFAFASLTFTLAMVVWRLTFFLSLRRRSLTVLIMGDSTPAAIAAQLIRDFSPSSRIVKWRPDGGTHSTGNALDPDEIPAVPENLDLLVLAGDSDDPVMIRKAAALRLAGVLVWDLPRLSAEFAERLPARSLNEHWLTTADGFRSLNEQSFQISKRLMDITMAWGGLLVASPLLVIGAILIKLQDGGAVIYSQERIGKGGNVFRVYKLRTMIDSAEEDTGPVWASPDDPRVTRVGRWLRKLRIDELPQLWNVLKGEMSCVGPRPERPKFVATLLQKYPTYSLRHLLRPGITGWAQIRCPYAASEEETLAKLEYDLYYLQHASLLFDLRIILKTISIVASAWGSR